MLQAVKKGNKSLQMTCKEDEPAYYEKAQHSRNPQALEATKMWVQNPAHHSLAVTVRNFLNFSFSIISTGEIMPTFWRSIFRVNERTNVKFLGHRNHSINKLISLSL